MPEVRQALEAGAYRPSPVRRVVIPMPGGRAFARGAYLPGQADPAAVKDQVRLGTGKGPGGDLTVHRYLFAPNGLPKSDTRERVMQAAGH